MLILKQEVARDVYCGNIIDTVRNGQITVSMLNIGENKKYIRESDLNKILYDDEIEYKINVLTNKTKNEIERASKTKQLIRSDHIDEEEKDSVLKICEQYSDIFHLEEETLSFT